MRLAYSCLAAGLMLAVSAGARAEGRDLNARLQGEYMITGFASCINSSGGFDANLNPIGPVRINTQTVQATRVFNGDGTGTDSGLSLIVNDPTPSSPASAGSSKFSGPFTYALNADLTVHMINAPFDSTNLTGPGTGQTFRIAHVPPFVGRASDDLGTIIIHHEAPAVETISDAHGNVVNQRICIRERTLTKVKHGDR